MLDPDKALYISDIAALAKRIAVIARLLAKEVQYHDAKKYDDLASCLAEFSDAIDDKIVTDPCADLPVIIDGNFVRIGSSKYENAQFAEAFSGLLLTEKFITGLRDMSAKR